MATFLSLGYGNLSDVENRLPSDGNTYMAILDYYAAEIGMPSCWFAAVDDGSVIDQYLRSGGTVSFAARIKRPLQ